MDLLTTTVTKKCIVAWKCPACGKYVASESKRACMASVPLGHPAFCDMSMDEIRKMLAEEIDVRVFKTERSNGDHQQANALSKVDVEFVASGYQYVDCPSCGSQPMWACERFENKKSEFASFFQPFQWPLLFMGVFILLCVVLGMFSFAVDLEDEAVVIVLFLSLALGVWVAFLIYNKLVIHKNVMHAVETPESYHKPLAIYRTDDDIDEEDPRSSALIAYIKEHPQVPFESTTKGGLRIHVDID